jgi:hypothetical protein
MSKSHPVVFMFGGIERHLTVDEAKSLVTSLSEALAVLEVKYGILHPSGCMLGIRHGTEMWGAEDSLVLFDTIAEALSRIALKKIEHPQSDWPLARVVRCYAPGQLKKYPRWEHLRDDELLTKTVLSILTGGFGGQTHPFTCYWQGMMFEERDGKMVAVQATDARASAADVGMTLEAYKEVYP